MKKNSGFTLIELMVVVAILGILAAIAYPSYMNYIRQARRADAHSALSQLQLAQERVRASTGSYTSSVLSAGVTAVSPEGYYNITIPTLSSTTSYTARATAVTGTSQAGDTGCTQIEVAVSYGSPNYTPAQCWKK